MTLFMKKIDINEKLQRLIETLRGSCCLFLLPTIVPDTQTNVPWKCEIIIKHQEPSAFNDEQCKVIEFLPPRVPSYFQWTASGWFNCPLCWFLDKVHDGGEWNETLLSSRGWNQVVQSQHQSGMGGTRGYKIGNWTPRSQSKIKQSGNSGLSWPFPGAREDLSGLFYHQKTFYQLSTTLFWEDTIRDICQRPQLMMF